MKTGTYIVLEGPDGGGTTTHCKLLCESLRKTYPDLVQTAEPTDGPIGPFIRNELKGKGMPADALQMLYSADRAWHMHKRVRPALAENKLIIGERFQLSTFLYGEALGLDTAWLREMNAPFVEPDLVLVLIPPFDVCAQRLGIRERDMLEQDSLQRKVYALYETYLREHSAAVAIDTSGSMESAAATILQTVKTFLADR